MKKITTILTLLMAGQLAYAGEPLAGHYYLKGMREVGSELLLKKEGQFQWMLSYGSMDQYAEGSWQQTGNQLILLATPPSANPVFRLFTEKEMRIRQAAEEGSWVAIVGVPRVGPVPGIEVQFESKSGKKLSAISDPSGDAIVKMPAGEEWARAGLRREKSKGSWQWLVIPPERAKARIAAFALDNPRDARIAPFEKMQLQIETEGLLLDDQTTGIRGLYTK